jgi:outer membrane lipoprotein SlyB
MKNQKYPITSNRRYRLKARDQEFSSKDIYERGNLMIASAAGGVLLGSAIMSIVFPAIATGTVIGAVAGGLMGAVVGSTTKSEN